MIHGPIDIAEKSGKGAVWLIARMSGVLETPKRVTGGVGFAEHGEKQPRLKGLQQRKIEPLLHLDSLNHEFLQGFKVAAPAQRHFKIPLHEGMSPELI